MRDLGLAVLVLLLASSASAQTRQLPPSRNLVTTGGSVAAEPPCFKELVDASRAFAGLAETSLYEDAANLYGDYLSDTITRAELKRRLEPRLAAESRWRRAVEACR